MSVQLLSQTGAAAPAPGGTGPIVPFPGIHPTRVVQFTPQPRFTGRIEIRGSNKPAPGANDFAVIASIEFNLHPSTFTLYIDDSSTTIQVVVVSATNGNIAVFGDSLASGLQGNTGTTLVQSSAVVSSQKEVKVIGNFVHINTPVVAAISSDDVIFSSNNTQTVTDVLDDFVTFTDALGTAGVTDADLAVLAGVDTCGLTSADLCKLADIDASASEINHLIGVTGNVQASLDSKAIGPGVDLTGLLVSAGDFNAFFDASPTVTISSLNAALTGLVATAADLNALAGTAGNVSPADFVKLGDIVASASEINTLVGITASSDDLNLISGAFAGTGAYTGSPLTSAEIAHLNGVSSNIQVQLDAKRNTADTIGVGEITGSSISITELNHLSGSSANIQAQIDALVLSAITPTGGTFTGPVFMADGSFPAPGLGFASANQTGFSLFGGSGLGVSVAGTRALSLDAAELTVGDATTGGAPLMRHSAMSETDPAYSFVLDSDTGMFWPGADEVALAVGGSAIVEASAASGVTLGGDVAANNPVVVSGVFSGEKTLGTLVIEAGNTGVLGDTPIYTVPAGRSAVVTKIICVLSAAVVGGGGFVAGPPGNNTLEINFGHTAPNFDDIVDNVSNSLWNSGLYDFDTAGQVMPLGFGDNVFPAISGNSGKSYQVISAGETLTARLVTLANFDSFELTVHVVGLEF